LKTAKGRSKSIVITTAMSTTNTNVACYTGFYITSPRTISPALPTKDHPSKHKSGKLNKRPTPKSEESRVKPDSHVDSLMEKYRRDMMAQIEQVRQMAAGSSTPGSLSFEPLGSPNGPLTPLELGERKEYIERDWKQESSV
jgi:hypothetical protein